MNFVNQASVFFFQPFFDKLIKRKWLNNTESFEAIEASIKQHFKKFKRMDCPPYQVTFRLLVRVLIERILVCAVCCTVCSCLFIKHKSAPYWAISTLNVELSESLTLHDTVNQQILVVLC